MHYKHEKSDYDDYLTQHAEIEAFVKTFLHTIIFKEAKRLKNLSGPALQQKIKEIIAKVIPAAYKKFKGTKSESIYRTVVKKLYMDTMEYLDSLKNP